MAGIIDDLKTAAELLERAAGLLRESAKVPLLGSEAERRTVRDEIVRIRLKLMFIRHDVTILNATANRRKPREPKKRTEG